MEAANSRKLEVDWDAVGILSIVLQGGVFASSIGDLANACAHWRSLFPQAQIILAISVSDCLSFADTGAIALTSAGLFDNLNLSWKRIAAACDCIVPAQPSGPLPPTKNDLDLPSNVNLQIAAAQAGLQAATYRYVLRVRNDFVFIDRSFLSQYCSGEGLPRGEFALFSRRIMISWLYTLNPYTVERMPFSFSDWFHFGELHDVRSLWQIPGLSLADAVYYKVHAHPSGSNFRERQFYSRVGAEQHIHFHVFHQAFPDLRLEHHNDTSSRSESIHVLSDNFVVCDIGAATVYFEKYKHELTNDVMLYHCITRSQWLDLVRMRHADPETTLAPAIQAYAATKRPISIPAVLPARSFKAREGRHVGDVLISRQPGLFFYGPYVEMAEGDYIATLLTDEITGSGAVHLKVTSTSGNKTLAERTLRDVGGELAITFVIERDGERQVEILCSLEGSVQVALRSVTIQHRSLSKQIMASLHLGKRTV